MESGVGDRESGFLRAANVIAMLSSLYLPTASARDATEVGGTMDVFLSTTSKNFDKII